MKGGFIFSKYFLDHLRRTEPNGSRRSLANFIHNRETTNQQINSYVQDPNHNRKLITEIFEHAVFTLVTNGAYGCVFRVTMPVGHPPLLYRSRATDITDLFNSASYVPVTSFIMKFCIANDSYVEQEIVPGGLRAVSVNAFDQERKKQYDVYSTHYFNGHAICPEILNETFRFTADNFNAFIAANPGKIPEGPLQDALDAVTRRRARGLPDYDHTEVCALVMADLQGYEPLHNLMHRDHQNPQRLTEYKNYGRLVSYKLLYYLGIVHNDLHLGNVMVNPITFDTKVIDFGRYIEIKNEQLQALRTVCKEMCLYLLGHQEIRNADAVSNQQFDMLVAQVTDIFIIFKSQPPPNYVGYEWIVARPGNERIEYIQFLQQLNEYLVSSIRDIEIITRQIPDYTELMPVAEFHRKIYRNLDKPLLIEAADLSLAAHAAVSSSSTASSSPAASSSSVAATSPAASATSSVSPSASLSAKKHKSKKRKTKGGGYKQYKHKICKTQSKHHH
jgi:hypothetical protein